MYPSKPHYRPLLTHAPLPAAYPAEVVDEYGERRQLRVAGEAPLTLYVDRREIVTLMTLGADPEALVLGYLRNQGMIADLHEIVSVQVDWETEAAAVRTRSGIAGIEEKLASRTVTTGCGQGTVFGQIMEDLERFKLPAVQLAQSTLYHLLDALAAQNEVYREAGAVHGCALCSTREVLMFVEDVGRHNAVDTIAGRMWLEDFVGADKIFYTTGRLTSEMVIKVAQMGIPVLLSRSGVTAMGLSLAQRLGVVLIARAKGRHFLTYHGAEAITLDARPAPRAPARALDSGAGD